MTAATLDVEVEEDEVMVIEVLSSENDVAVICEPEAVLVLEVLADPVDADSPIGKILRVGATTLDVGARMLSVRAAPHCSSGVPLGQQPASVQKVPASQYS